MDKQRKKKTDANTKRSRLFFFVENLLLKNFQRLGDVTSSSTKNDLVNENLIFLDHLEKYVGFMPGIPDYI